MHKTFAIEGNAYYCINENDITWIQHGLFCIDEHGYIDQVLTKDNDQYEETRAHYVETGTLKTLADTDVMIPGFIDLHNHASQWPQAGTALDRPLEIWLGEYTFPLEAKYRELDFANSVYQDLVSNTLAHGTTTAMYFATVDRKPSTLLAKICGELGQRGFVGKVVMDDPIANPDFCRDQSVEEAISETEDFIQDVLAVQNDYKQRVYPVITPRFIPSCSDETLKGVGKLVSKYNVHVQTHCSESDWEHNFVKERFHMNDAQALDSFGYLTNKTILAHAPFLSDEDVALLAKRKTSIAHSPISNAYFASSVLPFKQFSEKGVNIGLATDISGGYSPSMYTAIRQAVISSKMLNEGVNPTLAYDQRGTHNASITLNRAFYAATVAGGIALDLPLGKFEKGYAFDAQIIDTTKNIPHFYPEKKEEDLLHKILLLSESNNIKEVWVQGNRVK